MKTAYVVTVEYRDLLHRIVVEPDSVFTSQSAAAERRKTINNDPADHGMVADVDAFPLYDDLPDVVPQHDRSTHPHNSRLRPADVLEIRQRIAADDPYADIAETYGISLQTVSDIGRRKTWRKI